MSYKYSFTGAIIAKESECSILKCRTLYSIKFSVVKLWTNESGSEVSLQETSVCTLSDNYIVTDHTGWDKSMYLEIARRCKENYIDLMHQAIIDSALKVVAGHEEDFVLTVWEFSRQHPEAPLSEIMGQAIHRVLGD